MTGRAIPLAVLLLAALACGCTQAGPTCEVELAGVLATVDALDFLAVPVGLGGGAATMLVDTGAQGSLIVPAEAARLGLPVDPRRRTALRGVGGSQVEVPNVVVPAIRLGDRTIGPVSLPVRALPGGLATRDPPVAGLLGLDVLGAFDLDIDRRGGHLGLYLRHDCSGVRPPWTFPYDRLALRRTAAGFLVVPVRVDGVTLEAMIDTGARYSVLSRAAAAKLGLGEAALAKDAAAARLGSTRWRSRGDAIGSRRCGSVASS